MISPLSSEYKYSLNHWLYFQSNSHVTVPNALKSMQRVNGDLGCELLVL